MSVNKTKLHRAGSLILEAIGADTTSPELIHTPERFAKWWEEFIDYQDDNRATSFPSVKVDQMVVVQGIKVWSLCEHHLLPFYCVLTMGYIAEKEILGLSKFGRIAHQHAHRLQVQERLVEGIAEELAEVTGSPHVAVMGKGEHLCMTMRGIKTPATMVSSSTHGAFREDPTVRAEFFQLANGS